MGFSLKMMIKELEEINAKTLKPKQKQKQMDVAIAWWKKYADECGQLT